MLSAAASRCPEPPQPALRPFCFWLPHGDEPAATPADPAALVLAIRAHLRELAGAELEPLRWAITAIDPIRGLQLEGVGIQDGPR